MGVSSGAIVVPKVYQTSLRGVSNAHAVIARLDRATQYSRDDCDQSRSRSVLDPPLSRRMTVRV
jgi:hypothetical protein